MDETPFLVPTPRNQSVHTNPTATHLRLGVGKFNFPLGAGAAGAAVVSAADFKAAAPADINRAKHERPVDQV